MVNGDATLKFLFWVNGAFVIREMREAFFKKNLYF